jgi:hypothetical protein
MTLDNGKHAGGRPTKLTDELQGKIIEAIRGGCYIETAVAYAGINKDTFYAWLRRGAAELDRANGNGRNRVRIAEQPYIEFSDAVIQAQAETEMIDIVRIGLAGREDWKAAAWRLARKFPERWGRRDALELTGPNKGPIELEVSSIAEVTRDAARIKVERMEALKALPEGREDDDADLDA